MRGVAVLREQTRYMINDMPTDLVLSRSTRADDGAGGTIVTEATPLAPQRVKITTAAESTATERRTVGGEVVRPSLRLLAEWDADVLVGDTLVWNGLAVEVVWVSALPYEVVAELAVR